MIEQITLDMLDEISAETAAYKLIEPALIETMRNATTPADMLIFKADGAQYSSLYLGSENNLVCRISIRGRQSYAAIPIKYEQMIPADIDSSHLKSDPYYVRLPLTNAESIVGYAPLLSVILNDMIDALPTDFGCCSRYEACSDAGKCVNPDQELSTRCYYKRNLHRGKIFYGINKNV